MPRWKSFTALSALLLLTISIGGCSSQPKSAEDENTTDMRHIARAYELVINQSKKPPRDIEQIKSVLTELAEAKLNPPADEVLTSSRDGQPYVVILGANLGATRSADVLAYEAKGVEGKRYVLKMSYDVSQMTDAEFAQATFAMGHKPASK